MRWLELFAGAGGAALGIRAAGGEAVACVEWDEDAAATLEAAGFPAVCADVREYVASYDPITGLADSNCALHDAMWSSFPCQAWSQAGKREGAQDERNGWPWTVDALDVFRPRWFVAENVVGLAQHSSEGCGNPDTCPGCYFHLSILGQLRHRFASVQWVVLNASNFGVPQHRRRVFIVAGPRPIRWPKQTHTHPDLCSGLFATLKPWVTLGDVGGSPRGTQPERLGKPSLTCLARDHKGRSGAENRGRDVSSAADSWWLATGERQIPHEAHAKLQGFPLDYPWQGSKRARFSQSGNAVPPKLAEVVARAVMEADDE